MFPVTAAPPFPNLPLLPETEPEATPNGVAPDEAAIEQPGETEVGAEDYPDPIDRANISGLNPEELKRLGDEIMLLIESGVRTRKSSGRDDAWRKWRSLFECDPPARDLPWEGAANLRTPTTRNSIETVLGRLIDMLFKEEKFLRVTPKRVEDESAAAEMERFAIAELTSPEFDIRHRTMLALKNALVDGLFASETFWRHERREKTERVRLTPQVYRQITGKVANEAFQFVTIKGKRHKLGERYELRRDAITANHFDMMDICADELALFPATSRSVEHATLVAYPTYKSKVHMDYGVRDGLYDEGAWKGIRDKVANPNTSALASDSRPQGIEGDRGSRNEASAYPEHEEVKCWCGHARIVDANKDGYMEDVYFTVEETTRTILRLQRNPYHNNKRCIGTLIPDPRIGNRLYGYALTEKLKDIQFEDEAITNQQLDAGTVALTVIIEEEEGARRRQGESVFQPGINFRRVSQEGEIVKVHQMPSIPATNFRNQDDVRRMAERVSAASEAVQGGSIGGGETLGQTNISVTSGIIRLAMLLIGILRYLTWVYNQFFDYNIQFMDEERTYQIRRGGKIIYNRITLDQMQIPCKIEAYCPLFDPDLTTRRQFAEKLFTATTMSPFVQSDLGRMYEALRRYMAALGDENPEPVIGTKEEAMMMQQRVGAAQAAPMTPTPNGVATPGGGQG